MRGVVVRLAHGHVRLARVPQAHAAVARARGDGPGRIGARRHALHAARVPAQRQQVPLRRHVPQPRLLVAAGGDQPRVAVAPGHVEDCVVVRQPLRRRHVVEAPVPRGGQLQRQTQAGVRAVSGRGAARERRARGGAPRGRRRRARSAAGRAGCAPRTGALLSTSVTWPSSSTTAARWLFSGRCGAGERVSRSPSPAADSHGARGAPPHLREAHGEGRHRGKGARRDDAHHAAGRAARAAAKVRHEGALADACARRAPRF